MRRKDILGQYPRLRNKGMVVVGKEGLGLWELAREMKRNKATGRKGDAVSGRGRCEATKWECVLRYSLGEGSWWRECREGGDGIKKIGMRYMGLGLEEDRRGKEGREPSSDSSGYFGVRVCVCVSVYVCERERGKAFYLPYRKSYINLSGQASACSNAPYYTTDLSLSQCMCSHMCECVSVCVSFWSLFSPTCLFVLEIDQIRDYYTK